jgi:hypothetical protein
MEEPQSRIHLVLHSLGIKLHRPRLLHAWDDDDEDPNVWAVLQHAELCAKNM